MQYSRFPQFLRVSFNNARFDGKIAESAALREYVFLWPCAQERPTRERHNYLFTWGELRDRHYSPFCSARRSHALSLKKARNCIKNLFCDKNKQRVLSDKKRLPRTQPKQLLAATTSRITRVTETENQ